MTREERRMLGLNLSIEMWENIIKTTSCNMTDKFRECEKLRKKYNLTEKAPYNCLLCYMVGLGNCGSCIDWGDDGSYTRPCSGVGSPYRDWENLVTAKHFFIYPPQALIKQKAVHVLNHLVNARYIERTFGNGRNETSDSED